MTVVLVYAPNPECDSALEDATAACAQTSADLHCLIPHSRLGEHDADIVATRVRQRAEREGVNAAIYHVKADADLVGEVLTTARTVRAELVVVGIRRRSAVGKLILGRTAQRIILDSPCRVLVTHGVT